MKEAVAKTVHVFREKSFTRPNPSNTTKNRLNLSMVMENGIGFYGADFILDQDLDVWFLEPQAGCSLDDDFMFRVKMHDQLFTSMVDILEEILEKEQSQAPLLPLRNPGHWQVINADGWVYEYEGYARSNSKKGCTGKYVVTDSIHDEWGELGRSIRGKHRRISIGKHH